MNLAFIINKYYPFGGLQRDFVKIASECRARGHQVSVFTMAWTGDVPDGFNVRVMQPRGMSNHRRCLLFARQLAAAGLAGRYDLRIGFNKMPGLDLYFAGDPCYVAWAHEERGLLYRLGPRYRIYAALERAVFARGGKTGILLLNPAEKRRFIAFHQTEDARFHLVPPGIPRRQADRLADEEVRRKTRRDLQVPADGHLLLMVGSDFMRKGVDRAIQGVAALPAELRERCRLVILGQGDANPLMALAAKSGVAGCVTFLGARSDVSPYYLAADLLLHPARTEAAGMVLIEALVHGVPVLVTDHCGYAFHVAKARAGKLLPTPFDQQQFGSQLEEMLVAEDLQALSRNGLDYAARTDLYSLPQQAADILERCAAVRTAAKGPMGRPSAGGGEGRHGQA